MACRSSGSSIPGPSTSAARCRSSSACSRGARDTFHWKVFDRRRIVTTERSARARWRWAVTAAFGLGGITISAWGPRLPAIKAGLGIDTAAIGLLLAGVTVGAILGLLGSTPVLHWLGSRRAIAAALLLITAALAVMGLALIVGSVPLVAIAFVIVGLGIGTLDVLINVEFAAAYAASEAITRIFGGPIVDRLGRVRTIRVTTALGVVGVVLFILAGNPWIVLAGVVLWAVGVSMGFPLGMSAAAESGPDPAARVSVVASIGYFANLAGPPAIGVLAQSAGLLNSFWLIVALFFAAFAAAGSFRPRPAAPDPADAPRPRTWPAG